MWVSDECCKLMESIEVVSKMKIEMQIRCCVESLSNQQRGALAW